MDISQFLPSMPEVAQEMILKNGVDAVSIGDGVTRLNMSGHDKGVAYRFFMYQMYNKPVSDEKGYEVFDEVEMIEWVVDRKNKPTEMVRLLPEELLRFNREKECVGGRYKDAYLSWKTGKTAVGTPLRKWGILTDGYVASLEADGIYTVEQFAAGDRARIAAKYPDPFLDAYDRAVQFLAAKDVRASTGELASKVQQLEKEKAEMAERLAKLEALAAPKAAVSAPLPKSFSNVLETKK